MKFKIIITSLFSLILFTNTFAGGQSNLRAFDELNPPQPTQTGDKIEVVEVFWYGCPHCYSLEPYLEKWLEGIPEDVEFRRVPGVLGKNWLPHARAYYTAEILGILDNIHKPLFEAIHRDNKNIMDEKRLRDFFVQQGVKKAEFDKVYRSQEVTDRIKEAFTTSMGYKLTGVPAIIVNGKYHTSASMTGSNQKLIEVIDQLVDRERQNTSQ
jgi:protein dithiol oxidoreductase (disulfide-forming)